MLHLKHNAHFWVTKSIFPNNLTYSIQLLNIQDPKNVQMCFMQKHLFISLVSVFFF